MEYYRSVIIRLALVGLMLLPNARKADFTRICDLQGRWFSTSYEGQWVKIRGVVTADFDLTAQKGFFVQEPGCDHDPDTSDGLFVYLSERRDMVSTGDLITVIGRMQEYYGMTELDASPDEVYIIAQNIALPAAEELDPPLDYSAARSYYEAREGMYVGLAHGRVVGPTDDDDRTWVIPAGWGVSRIMYDDIPNPDQTICIDDTGLYELAPESVTGNVIRGATGVLEFRIGIYCLALTAPAEVIQENWPATENSLPDGYTVVTWNLAGLFDNQDDPLTDDVVLSNAEYERRLDKRGQTLAALGLPALVAVQEAETLATLQALAERDELQNHYQALLIDGPDRRGSDVGLLYRSDQVEIMSAEAFQGCTALVDGLGPDGNDDTDHPANELTCRLDGGDGLSDGNRLFSRPPLGVHLWLRGSGQDDPRVEIVLLINHWKSKVEDRPGAQVTGPRRAEQANFVARMAERLSEAHPGAVVLAVGDLNDTPGSLPIETLQTAGFENLLLRLDREQRYTYIYQGISQPLDAILIRPAFGLAVARVVVFHNNADYPGILESVDETLLRSSDHDPVVVVFQPVIGQLFLPISIK